MKKVLLCAVSAIAFVIAAAPANAQHVTPASTTFVASGPNVVLTKVGYPTQTCTLTLNASTGAQVASSGPHANHAADGNITSGSNTGGGLCAGITISASHLTMDSTYTGSGPFPGKIDHLVVNLGTPTLCDQTNVPFTISSGGQVAFNTNVAAGTLPGLCHVTGTLTTSPTISGVN